MLTKEAQDGIEILKALMPAYTALLGTVSALGGVYLTNWHNDKRAKLQSAEVDTRENKKMLINKGEECHQLLTKFRTLVSNTQTYQIGIAKGVLTDKDLKELTDGQEHGELYGKLNTLIGIYFSDLKADWDALMKEADAVTHRYIYDRPANENTIEQMTEHQQNSLSILNTIERKLTEKIRQIIVPAE